MTRCRRAYVLLSLEHELTADTSLRFSYVRKQTRDNLPNANPKTDFIWNTGLDFGNIIEWLPGRTFQIGLRFQSWRGSKLETRAESFADSTVFR